MANKDHRSFHTSRAPAQDIFEELLGKSPKISFGLAEKYSRVIAVGHDPCIGYLRREEVPKPVYWPPIRASFLPGFFIMSVKTVDCNDVDSVISVIRLVMQDEKSVWGLDR